MADGEDASDEEDDEEVAPAVGSPKPKEMGVDPKRLSPMWGMRQLCPSLRKRLRVLRTLLETRL